MPVTQEQRSRLKAMTRSSYDLQALRIQSGLRLCANFRSKLGQVAGESEEDLEEGAKKIIDQLRDSFRLLTDGIAKNRLLPKKEGFVGDEIISDYTELMLVSQYLELQRVERQQFGQLEAALEDFPIWHEFFKPTRGIGPAMAAVIISEVDVAKAKYVSSLWAFAGLDVAPDGRGRSRKKEHLVRRKYIDKDGVEQERDSITYSPTLKTKLMGVVAPSFLRSGSDWREHYDNYKHRIETDPAREKWSDKRAKEITAAGGNPAVLLWRPGRIHQASLRFMVKEYLKALYCAWRPLEGLEVYPSYQEAKQGHFHGDDRVKMSS